MHTHAYTYIQTHNHTHDLDNEDAKQRDNLLYYTLKTKCAIFDDLGLPISDAKQPASNPFQICIEAPYRHENPCIKYVYEHIHGMTMMRKMCMCTCVSVFMRRIRRMTFMYVNMHMRIHTYIHTYDAYAG